MKHLFVLLTTCLWTLSTLATNPVNEDDLDDLQPPSFRQVTDAERQFIATTLRSSLGEKDSRIPYTRPSGPIECRLGEVNGDVAALQNPQRWRSKSLGTDELLIEILGAGMPGREEENRVELKLIAVSETPS